MKYVIKTIDQSVLTEVEYITYFYKRGWNEVYKFITNGCSCTASLVHEHPNLPLQWMNSNSTLPKYIKENK